MSSRIAQMVDELNLRPGVMKLIVNRAPEGELNAGVKEEIAAQHLDLIGVIPQDPAVYEADCAGTPTSKIPEDSLSKKALHGILTKLGL